MDCIFCKITKGEVESIKIWENEKFIAILDVNPNVKGMTLVFTKDHYDSDAFYLPDEIYSEFMKAAKAVAKILEKGLSIARVSMIMEGMGINHVHIKLYPLHGVIEKFKEIWAKERVYFEKYEGYISTQLGPKADLGKLRELAEEIRKKNI